MVSGKEGYPSCSQAASWNSMSVKQYSIECSLALKKKKKKYFITIISLLLLYFRVALESRQEFFSCLMIGVLSWNGGT